MTKLRRAGDRGRTNLDWVDSQHTFSFGQYYDESFVGFRSLRVINEDRVAPSQGFPSHAHRDMEILSYVVSGALEHKDNLGTGSVIKPGDIQRMSAGTGVLHSEYNASADEPVHFLQIWIVPDRTGIPPSYEQKTFPPELRQNVLCALAAGGGQAGAIGLQQDAKMFGSLLEKSRTLRYHTEAERGVWVQVVKGKLRVNDLEIRTGDGIGFEEESDFFVSAIDDTEFLLFDLK